MSKLDRVIVGNVVIYPALAEFLKRSCYYLGYDPDKELITLFANDGGGGQDLMQIRNASHENALKLAKELGLKTQNLDQDHACSWGKYYDVLHLYHNDSEEDARFFHRCTPAGTGFASTSMTDSAGNGDCV